jgi:hypothetical protein
MIKARGYATFSEAAEAILAILADGEWHKRTAEIGRLSYATPKVADHMFLKVKKRYKIEHRQVGGGPGSYSEWRLPPGRRG